MAKIKCLQCGEVMHSTHRHDFQKCSCENGAFADGGYDYCRYGAVDVSLVEVLPDPKPPTVKLSEEEIEEIRKRERELFLHYYTLIEKLREDGELV